MKFSTAFTRRASLAAFAAVTFAALTPLLSHGQTTGKPAMKDKTMRSRLGLEGYCPVCIIDAKKWVKGTSEHEVTYDGITYRFPGTGPKEKFVADPAKYVPALGGDCIVCYAKLGKRVPGNVRHAAYHEGRLFLFPSNKEKQAFLASPTKFANADLALNGECSVCLVHVNKHVPGEPGIAAIHDGLRYLFPSNKERQAFLQDPARYAQSTREHVKSIMMTASLDNVSVTGETGCAGCEHGVTPIGAPGELGLSVTTKDGRVFVVEDAHKLWPSIYKARYDGQNIAVSGRVVKTQDGISWIKPTTLRVL